MDLEENLKNENEIFNKEEWLEKKNTERTFLFELADKKAIEIMNNSQEYKKYLNVQVRFDKYSVNNALLITAQMPTATQLKEYKDWNKRNVFVKKNATRVKILEPSDPYNKKDGTVGISYNPKTMIDISQTNAHSVLNENAYSKSVLKYNDNDFFKILIKTAPVKITIKDSLPNEKLTIWDEEMQEINILKGAEFPTILIALSEEISKHFINKTGSVLNDNFKSKSISYFICNKYGIDVSSFNFDSMPEDLKKLNSSEIKLLLGEIKYGANEMCARINSFIEKEEKNKEYER